MDVYGRQGSTSTPHGVKRRAEDDLKDDQRLARRLNHLHIGTKLSVINFTLGVVADCNDIQSKMAKSASQDPARRMRLANLIALMTPVMTLCS